MPHRQGGLFIVLGGAPCVWDDYRAARAMVGPDAGVIACNHAGMGHKGDLHAWATLHPDMMGAWRVERGGPQDFPVFAPQRHPHCPDAIPVEPRWVGSSGMYVVQIGVLELQAAGLILCGIPMDPEAGHISYPGRWTGGEGYRKPFADAMPTIGGRVRSMGGWTQQLFGAPTRTWLEALSGAKPFARPTHSIPTRQPMYTVKNISDSAQRITYRDSQGELASVMLQPGESGDYDVDAAQARYQPGGRLTATPIGATASPKPAGKPKPKGKSKPRTKAVAPKPAVAPKQPVNVEPAPVPPPAKEADEEA